ncbi:MAG: hypothetical protein LBL35_06090 [Clostridiales bacterium]|nr:hypothetical protein [Clostridiales bacterium]
MAGMDIETPNGVESVFSGVRAPYSKEYDIRADYDGGKLAEKARHRRRRDHSFSR